MNGFSRLEVATGNWLFFMDITWWWCQWPVWLLSAVITCNRSNSSEGMLQRMQGA
jgi:hypothetical protein